MTCAGVRGSSLTPSYLWTKEILEAYGGRSPRVLDPFAGGGAIPLEAMRLGCDVTAMDINRWPGSSSSVPLSVS